MFPWRKRREQELDEEIAAHLRMAEADLGKDAARREFGNAGLVKEVTRGMWGWSVWERLWQDVRYALRILRKNPGYLATAALSLALGIGANTAIFSLIDAIMLQSLPVKNPQELVSMGDQAAVQSLSQGTGGNNRLFSYPFYKRFRTENNVFTDLYASGRSERIDLADEAEHPHARFVSNNFFDVLGVGAVQGRTFMPADRETVVISYDYWQRRYQGVRGVAGRKLIVSHAEFVIVGVAPRDFFGDVVGYETDLWFPIETQPLANPGRSYIADPDSFWLQMMGRLKPGVSLAQAAAAVNSAGMEIIKEQAAAKSLPDELKHLASLRIAVQPAAGGFSRIRQSYSQPLKILMTLVALVLLICCANVANLQMARAVSRGREMGLRLAIGAGRGRLVRQLLTESMVLSATGGLAALFFGYWMSRLLLELAGRSNRLPMEPHLSGRALLFTAGISLIAVLVFGLVPALFATNGDVAANLKESRMGRSGSGAQRFEKSLVVFQIALSLLLLFGSGLFIRTLQNLEKTDVGYRRENLLIAEMDPWASGYKDAQVNHLARDLVAAVGALPGVTSVSFSENGLFSGTGSESANLIEGFTARSREDSVSRSDRVGSHYFETLGTPILAGRGIEDRDGERAARVLVINESMARFYFGNVNPLERHISDPDGKNPMTIVGVARDSKQRDLREPAARRFYTPYLQHVEADEVRGLRLEVRTEAWAGGMAKAIKQAIKKVEPNLREAEIEFAQTLIEDDLLQERVIAKLSGFFSVLALILASVGLYGVMSYLTARRTTEVGVRMALGASRATVVGMILREAFVMTAVALAIGVSLAAGAGQLIAKTLYGVQAFDPLTLTTVAAIICGAVLFAAWFPARRAAGVDPMVALRAE